jgi:hypothetical protein
MVTDNCTSMAQKKKPFFYSNANNQNINVTEISVYTYLVTDFHLYIQHGNCEITLLMPEIDDTYGSKRLCGLAGNIDKNCINDLLNRCVVECY